MAQKKKKGGFFSSLSNAVNDMAGDLDRGIKSVTTDISNSTINPLGYWKPGYVVMISSRANFNKCLTADAKGNVFCTGPPNNVHNVTAQFTIMPSTYGPAFKLRSVANPDHYLAIVNDHLVGNGTGGPECDFYGLVAPAGSTVEIAEYMSLQSAMHPTSFIGVSQGKISVPSQTNPAATHAAHFKLKYIKTVALPQVPTQSSPQLGQASAPSAPPPQQGQYPPPQGAPPQGQYPPPQGAPPQGQYPPPQGAPPQGQYPPPQGAPPQGQYPPQQQYPAATAPPPYSQYPQAQQPSPGMEKKPL